MRLTAFALSGACALVGCGSDGGAGAGDAIAITSTDSACDVSQTTLAAGKHTFVVSNKGTQTTEVYVYQSGDKVVTEKEHIGPGTSAKFTADLKAGQYEIACKPGEKGSGIRQKITVA